MSPFVLFVLFCSYGFFCSDSAGLEQQDAKGTKVFSKRIRVQTLSWELAGLLAAAYTVLAVADGF